MIIQSKDTLPYQVLKVYETVRDHQADLVPYMPDIRAVEVIEREEQPDQKVRLLNHWHGAAEIPSLIKKFIKPEMMSWKDYALWHDDELYVAWRLETFYLNDLFSCEGTTRFIKLDENKTEMLLKGDLKINASAVPGVPTFLARKLSPQIESFIARLISPNLNNLSKGVLAYLNDQK
ncbi:hypothetical protein ACFL27_07840 [candidate division CSSED10-310 bacterium]|uniref:Coenzyme Q-binding protein COQ10 START domain-containing protein n=1 Tax=candidate division CSSED10-310 bacterium TaxID=2855610 RepID=A0ABV6YV57_UNCC1